MQKLCKKRDLVLSLMKFDEMNVIKYTSELARDCISVSLFGSCRRGSVWSGDLPLCIVHMFRYHQISYDSPTRAEHVIHLLSSRWFTPDSSISRDLAPTQTFPLGHMCGVLTFLLHDLPNPALLFGLFDMLCKNIVMRMTLLSHRPWFTYVHNQHITKLQLHSQSGEF